MKLESVIESLRWWAENGVNFRATGPGVVAQAALLIAYRLEELTAELRRTNERTEAEAERQELLADARAGLGSRP